MSPSGVTWSLDGMPGDRSAGSSRTSAEYSSAGGSVGPRPVNFCNSSRNMLRTVQAGADGVQRLASLPGVEQLWAPWRLEYVQHADEEEGCVFCRAAALPEDEPELVVHRGELAFVLLNKFPYASGHLMVAPYRHPSAFDTLPEAEAAEVQRLAVAGIEALRTVYAPDGFNVGWNLGRVAGAGIVDHAHVHVVPRWGGDTNFMPVLADVRVIPEHLAETRRRLAEAWQRG